MSTALVVFVLVLLLPLFLASWRVSLVGLASQGAIMAWLAYDRDGVTTVADGVRLVDLGLVRSLIVPVALYQVMRARGTSARNDVIAPNLVSWTLALTAVLVGFRFAAHMPLPDSERPFVAAAASALLLAMLVLASSDRLFSQAVGVFRFAGLDDGDYCLSLDLPGNDWWYPGTFDFALAEPLSITNAGTVENLIWPLPVTSAKVSP